MDELEFIRKFGDKCCAEVSRKGESQPCDKVAVAVTVDNEEEYGNPHWWPVCAHHARGRGMVPLTELLAAMRRTAQA